MMAMATACESLQWLRSWLGTPFYEERCTKHKSQYLTVFCTECQEKPICTICFDNEKQHEGHKTLKVCIASRRAAVHVSDASRFLGISRIQVYRINHKDILHLISNVKEIKEQKNAIAKHKCSVCEAKINDPIYNFCSIGCKLAKLGVNGLRIAADPPLNRKRIEERANEEGETSEPMTPWKRVQMQRIIIWGTLLPMLKRVQEKKNDGAASAVAVAVALAPASKRKHRRKGIPIRSPLS